MDDTPIIVTNRDSSNGIKITAKSCCVAHCCTLATCNETGIFGTVVLYPWYTRRYNVIDEHVPHAAHSSLHRRLDDHGEYLIGHCNGALGALKRHKWVLTQICMHGTQGEKLYHVVTMLKEV